jgi:hypothetical protein
LIKGLEERITKVEQKSFPRCWFGIKCRRIYYRFDHSFLFRKDNRLEHDLPKSTGNDDMEVLCEQCGLIFKSKTHLNEHIGKSNGKTLMLQTKHTCRECNFKCDSRSDLNLHVISNHNEDEIECEQCEKFFVSRKELNDHRRTHADVDQDIQSLNNMLKGILNNEEMSNDVVKIKCQQEKKSTETLTCDDCSEIFLLKANLRKHSKSVHKVNKTENTKQTENDPFRNNPMCS